MEKKSVEEALLRYDNGAASVGRGVERVCVQINHLSCVFHMWECHLWASTAVWVEEAGRLWGGQSRGYRGCARSSILNQSGERHWCAITAEDTSTAPLRRPACSCSIIKAQGRAQPAEAQLDVSSALLVSPTSQWDHRNFADYLATCSPMTTDNYTLCLVHDCCQFCSTSIHVWELNNFTQVNA